MAEPPPPDTGHRANARAAAAEALRRAHLRVQAKVRYLEARAGAAPLAPSAVARLEGLRREAEALRRDLRRVLRATAI